MPTVNPLEARWGILARLLFKAFQAGNEASFFSALDRLGEARERDLYKELRTLAVGLHRTLDEFRSNSRLANLAGKEMPYARLRLDHVLKLTEEATHRTLDLVERSGPLADRIAKGAVALSGPLQQLRGSDKDAVVESSLLDIETFLVTAKLDGEAVRANLAEVLMAQSFQDLTGQIIRRVINLVAELERTLGHFAGGMPGQPAAATSVEPSNSSGHGPAVPGVSAGSVGEQEDVDALLAKMGM